MRRNNIQTPCSVLFIFMHACKKKGFTQSVKSALVWYLSVTYSPKKPQVNRKKACCQSCGFEVRLNMALSRCGSLYLFGQQLLAQRVKCDKLPRQHPCVYEALGHQHDFTDQLEVWYHHGARPVGEEKKKHFCSSVPRYNLSKKKKLKSHKFAVFSKGFNLPSPANSPLAIPWHFCCHSSSHLISPATSAFLSCIAKVLYWHLPQTMHETWNVQDSEGMRRGSVCCDPQPYHQMSLKPAHFTLWGLHGHVHNNVRALYS